MEDKLLTVEEIEKKLSDIEVASKGFLSGNAVYGMNKIVLPYALALQAEKDKHRWRDVNKELPEENQWVEVYSSTGHIFKSRFKESSFKVRPHFYHSQEVTHWKPIHAPQDNEMKEED